MFYAKVLGVSARITLRCVMHVNLTFTADGGLRVNSTHKAVCGNLYYGVP